jgi:mannosyltransferase
MRSISLAGARGFLPDDPMHGPDLIVTNFNPRFTGVSATAAAVTRALSRRYDLRVAGQALPGIDVPVTVRDALRLTRAGPQHRPFTIWHVRRNAEMQAAIFARDVLRLPMRIVFTSAAQRRHSAWPRWLISKMDAVIATTDEAAGFVPNVWAVVPHGVDCDAFRPAPDRAAAWAATGFSGARGMAAIGRVRPEKGTDLFVQAMIRALPGLPDATALVIGLAKPGEAGFLQGLKDSVVQAGLERRILFPGEIAPDRMRALIPALSLLVALPRYEGYGLTPLEAMASGVPVVASDAGHFRAFLGQNEAGRIVGVCDAEAASLAVTEILSDPTRHAGLSVAARIRAEGGFGIETEAAGIAAVYERLWAE